MELCGEGLVGTCGVVWGKVGCTRWMAMWNSLGRVGRSCGVLCECGECEIGDFVLVGLCPLGEIRVALPERCRVLWEGMVVDVNVGLSEVFLHRLILRSSLAVLVEGY